MYGGNSPTEEPVFLSSREYITKALALKERPIRMPEGLNEDQEETIRDIMLGIKMYTQIAQDERPYNKSWEPLRLEDWDTLKDIYQQLGEHASYLGLVHEATDEFRRWARRTGYIDEIERIIDSSENSPVNNTAPENGSQRSGTVVTYSPENMDWGDGPSSSSTSEEPLNSNASLTSEEPLNSNAEFSVNFNASNSGSNGRQGEGVRKKRAKPTRRKRTRKPKPARKTKRKSDRKPARKSKRKTTRKR